MTSPFGSDELVFNALLCADTYLGRPRVNRVARPLRRWNQRRLLERVRLHAAEPREPSRLEVVSELPPDEFRRKHLKPSEPVVMKGFAKKFPAVGLWSPEFFRDAYGDMIVETVDGERREIADLEAGIGQVHTARMTVAEQVNRMLDGGRDYVSFWTELFTRHPELGHDIDVERLREYIRPGWFRNPIFKFFMGAGGTSTAWHCAELQNFFVQIYGTKEWQFCPPSWTACLDPRVVSLSQQYCHSMIDFRAPDHESHPLYAYAPLRRVVLEPGDVLYVPPFWWHCVYNPEVSIGLAVWWINLLPALRSHPTLFWLTVMSPQHVFRQIKERLERKDHRTAVTTGTIFRRHGAG